jgi:threonine dehydrogenase-like Zn-dependent dehydrogenase
LKTLGSKARVLITARYEFQAQAAQKLGADEVLRGPDIYEQVAQKTGASLYKPPIGKRVMLGGADRVYECVGNDGALDDANRLAKSNGTVVDVGVPGVAKGVDWAAIFAQGLKILVADRYSHSDNFNGKKVRTFDLALDLMASGKVDLAWMVSKKYPLKDYSKVLKELRNKRSHPIIKAAFTFDTEV